MKIHSFNSVVLVYMNEGKILAVSRKNDATKFGLVGGKIDLTDYSLESALIRECKEETGLDIEAKDLQYIGRMDDIAVFYTNVVSGEISTNESGVVAYVDWNTLYKGGFIEENIFIHSLMCKFISSKISEFLDKYGNFSIDKETYGTYNSPEANTLEAMMYIFNNNCAPMYVFVGSHIHGGFKNIPTLVDDYKNLKSLINNFIICSKD